MREIAGLFGTLVVIGFTFVMLNFVLKYLNKTYISKLPKDKKKYIDVYRTIMRIFIKYHKTAGIITTVLAIIHFVLMYVFVRISVSGIIAFILMLLIFILGIYGAFINKNFKGNWLKVHRALAFILVLSIVLHVI